MKFRMLAAQRKFVKASINVKKKLLLNCLKCKKMVIAISIYFDNGLKQFENLKTEN